MRIKMYLICNAIDVSRTHYHEVGFVLGSILKLRQKASLIS